MITAIILKALIYTRSNFSVVDVVLSKSKKIKKIAVLIQTTSTSLQLQDSTNMKY